MPKYRLIKHDFTFNFANWSLESFPYIQFNRPVIYLGVFLPRVVDTRYPYPPEEQVQYSETDFLSVRATCGLNESIRVIQPSRDLLDLICSDSIDCSDIEVTGEISVHREDFINLVNVTWAPMMSMLFLEKINY